MTDLSLSRGLCVHGIPLRMVCSECHAEAGRRPGCAACITKDAEIARLREENAHLRDSIKSYQKADEEIAREGR